MTVVGAGPTGLTLAIDLAQRGVQVTLLDQDLAVSDGSRAICLARRTLDVFRRLGVGDKIAGRGVGWNVGRIFFRSQAVCSFDLIDTPDVRHPPFVNLPQFEVESALIERAKTLGVDLRFGHKVSGIAVGKSVRLTVEAGQARYELHSDYAVAADGARSEIRRFMGLTVEGDVFPDRFLIADIRMEAAFPSERWFWFDPPFHPRQSALLHRQPDNLWRIDFQLGREVDPAVEREPERVRARIAAMLGDTVRFTIEWISVYTFSCVRMSRFVHGSLVFAGDSAHLVSPFGARGANGGIQDADNLGWKLALIQSGHPDPVALLKSYEDERGEAADENLKQTRRSTEFISPSSLHSRRLRDGVLALARTDEPARKMINSGRLSVAGRYTTSDLVEPSAGFSGGVGVGAALDDWRLASNSEPGSSLFDRLGAWFCLLYFGLPSGAQWDGIDALVNRFNAAQGDRSSLRLLAVLPAGTHASDMRSMQGVPWERFDALDGTVYLIRPDQHVAGRWRQVDASLLLAAVQRAHAVKQPHEGRADGDS